MAEQRATGRATMADERHDDAQERRARRAQRVADRERSDSETDAFKAGREHQKRVGASKRRHPAGASSRKVTKRVRRSATAPTTGAVLSMAGLFGIALSLVALYLVLTSAETVDKVVKLTRRGLHWLASPSTSIPYGKES